MAFEARVAGQPVERGKAGTPGNVFSAAEEICLNNRRISK
jgi:hypothetical protein